MNVENDESAERKKEIDAGIAKIEKGGRRNVTDVLRQCEQSARMIKYNDASSDAARELNADKFIGLRKCAGVRRHLIMESVIRV